MLGIACPKADIQGPHSESFRGSWRHQLNSLNVWKLFSPSGGESWWPTRDWCSKIDQRGRESAAALQHQILKKLPPSSVIRTWGRKKLPSSPVKLWQCGWGKNLNLWETANKSFKYTPKRPYLWVISLKNYLIIYPKWAPPFQWVTVGRFSCFSFGFTTNLFSRFEATEFRVFNPLKNLAYLVASFFFF